MMRRFASLRQALLLHFVAAATLPILLLGLLASDYLTNQQLDRISDHLNTHTVDVRDEAEELLNDVQFNLELIARTLDSEILDNNAELDRYLQVAVSTVSYFESVYLLDSALKVSNLGVNEKLQGRQKDYRGLDFSAHDLFMGGARLEAPAWSNTFVSLVTGEPSITLGLPVENGTLIGTVSLRRLGDFLERRVRIEDDITFAIVDQRGTLVAHSDPYLAQQRVNLRYHPEIQKALQQGVEVAQKFHEDMSLIESVRVVSRTGWVAFATIPREVVLQPVHRVQKLLVSTLGGALVLGILFSIWVSRRLTLPLIRLRDATRAVAAGDYDWQLKPLGYNEIEDLSQSVRVMASSVQDREASLRESESRYRELVDSIDGIVWEFDLSTHRFVFVSQQAEHLLGFSVSNWIEEPEFWPRHVHPDDFEEVQTFLTVTSPAVRDFDFEFRMLAADFRTIWLKNVVSVIVEGDRPVRLRGVMIDITARKRAEQSVREMRDRLQVLIDRMPMGCITWDQDFRATLWNPAAEKIFGFPAADALGRHALDFLLTAEMQPQVEEIIARLKVGDQTAHSRNENLTRDGRTIVCDWYNTPMLDSDGRHLGTISMVRDVTEQEQAEKALRESEERFRTLFQTGPDAMLVSSLPEGRIVDVNDGMVRLSGYAREDLLGKTSLEVGLWVEPANRDELLQQFQAKGQIDNFEIEGVIRDGSRRTGLLSARPIILENRPYMLSVVRDISELKAAEMQLRRSEERFRSLVGMMGEGLIIRSREGGVIECNRAAEQILGRSRDELFEAFSTDSMLELFDEHGAPLDREGFPATLTLRTGQPVKNHLVGISRPDGTVAWLQVNSKPFMRNLEGEPEAVVVTFADVSEIKNTEDRLRELTRQFEIVLSGITDHIDLLDSSLQVIWSNRRDFSDLATSGTAQTDCCYRAWLGREAPCVGCPVVTCFESKGREEGEMTDDNGRTWAMRVFPILDANGRVEQAILISQDITDKRLNEQQRIRTGQLAALGELAAGVAHEINNPITGIINYAQLIYNRTPEESREHEIARRIIKEGDRIATIVRELLYFARDEGQEVSMVRVKEVLGEALSLLESQLHKESIILELDVAENLPRVESRRHQIQQLFLNLISNARHALGKKYPQPDPDKILRVTARRVERDERPFVQIVFRDHGTGIPADLLKRVMNPFVTTKPAGEGTGLGLSISHEIVQKHYGTLDIQSVEGAYTEVSVELPVESTVVSD